ncbi:MAG: transcription-repair coupling factor [Elusimicrobia bacterium]|nr:transcription-repair coupling factor [Elusimicrobiota bacterium]
MRVVGLPGSGAWGHLARSLLSGNLPPGFAPPSFRGRLLLLAGDPSELEDMADAFAALAPLFGGENPPVALFGEEASLGPLEALRAGARLVLAPPEALAKTWPARADFEARGFELKAGMALGRTRFLERLSEAGYRRVDFVESPGEFAARGAVADFFNPHPAKAVRVLFDESSVVSMRSFDPVSQSTLDFVGETRVSPESLDSRSASLWDWMGEDAVAVAPESLEVAAPASARLWRAGRILELSAEDLDFGARPHPSHGAGPSAAWAEMKARAREGWRVILYSLNRGEDSRAQEILEAELSPGQCQFLIGPLRQGFLHPGLKLCVMATSEIFSRHYRPSRAWRSLKAPAGQALRFRELKKGDYVVHQDHGISRYRGLTPIESPGHGAVDCLHLEFRGSDTLYVPMAEFSRIQKYSGAEGKRPRLSSLDRRSWEEVKHQVREGVRELAQELLRIQAERAGRPGHAFPPDSAMEREFAQAFPYEETEDQNKAIAAVMEDMTAGRPMDRLIVGDVGFGKTEVAMRAAFKCVAGFKQAAVLVPTTILADQHFRTFLERLADYPARLGLLTRFQKPAEHSKVLEGLKAGTVDIVIGTTRLLQKGVAFKDLGLIIVDEEHRFGVRDKERLKSLRKTVDILSLSATPIPRTLHQAMSGVREISLIQSPPVGRQPITTKVGPWDEAIVASAISEELSRGGQAYYVHNRVRTLAECLDHLKKIVPEARLAMVHGKMKAEELETAMWDFFNKKFDVLVASTIIESGLDIPSVNTLLVEDAHEFGLAQLYQLRGRIGRESRKASCYFFYPKRFEEFSALSEEARQRLEALREFADLGSGIKLAMRDMEMRGAGELLGARQHGFMNAVGADFYAQMLGEEVERLSGSLRREDDSPVALDLNVAAYIPESYLPDEMARLEFYKRILRAAPGESESLLRELEDLSGPAPQPVLDLLRLLNIRSRAKDAGVRSLAQKGRELEVHFRIEAPLEPSEFLKWAERYRGRLKFLRSLEGDGFSLDLGSETALDWLEGFFAGLQK